MAFNDFVLDFAGITLGDPVVGDQLDLFSLGSITGVLEDPNPDVGLVDFFEISLDAPSDLDSMQERTFILAILMFDAENFGVSPLNFASVVLADSLGNTLTATTSSGIIAVPEPDTLALLTVGLAGLGFVNWRRRRGHLIQAV